jgi:hypothetical protein
MLTSPCIPTCVDVFAIRRLNLRQVLNRYARGNQSVLAKAVGQPPNLISRYLSHKNIGDWTARRVESAYLLEPGSLDHFRPEERFGRDGAAVSEKPMDDQSAQDLAQLMRHWFSSDPAERKLIERVAELAANNSENAR